MEVVEAGAEEWTNHLRYSFLKEGQAQANETEQAKYGACFQNNRHSSETSRFLPPYSPPKEKKADATAPFRKRVQLGNQRMYRNWGIVPLPHLLVNC